MASRGLPLSAQDLGVHATVRNTFLAFACSRHDEDARPLQRSWSFSAGDTRHVSLHDVACASWPIQGLIGNEEGSGEEQPDSKSPESQSSNFRRRLRAASETSSGSSQQNGCAKSYPRDGKQSQPTSEEDATTVMLRQVPRCYTQMALKDELESEGFLGCFDFLYLPQDVRRDRCRGYAFINFADSSLASQFLTRFDGRFLRRGRSQKPLNVQPADIQGLEALAAHFEAQRMDETAAGTVKPLFMPVRTAQLPGEVASSSGSGRRYVDL